MCGHVLLVFIGGWLSWVMDVSHFCAPVIESHLSVLHVLVVCLIVQLASIVIVRRARHTVTFSSFFAGLTQWRSYGFSSFGFVFHAHYSAVKKLGCCSRTWLAFLALFHSRLDWLRQPPWACARWHPHEQIKHVRIPFLSEHWHLLSLPVHDVRLIIPNEQIVPGLDDVGGQHQRSSHICNLPRALAHKSLKGPNGHDRLPVVLDVLHLVPWILFHSWTSLFAWSLSRETCFSASHSLLLLSLPPRWPFHQDPAAFRETKWFSPLDTCSSSSSSARKWTAGRESTLLPHLVTLPFLGQHYCPSSSCVSMLASSSAFSPSSSLTHDDVWSSSSSVLLAHLYGQFTPMCPCSPQS